MILFNEINNSILMIMFSEVKNYILVIDIIQ